MKLIHNIVAVILVALAGMGLRELCGAHEHVPTFAVTGAMSFFLGPYCDGSG